MNDNVAERISAVGNIVDKLTTSKAVLVIVLCIFGIISYTLFENRKEIYVAVVANPDLLTLPGIFVAVGTVIFLLARGYRNILDRLEQSHERIQSQQVEYIEHLKGTVEAQRKIIFNLTEK